MMRESIKQLGVLAAIGVFATPSMAQVTTPPPKAPEAGEAYTPPPRRTPVRAGSANSGGRGQIASAPVPRHRPLAEPGEDGYIVILDRLPDEVAIERNPYIGESKNQAIHDLRVERQARMERQIIENIDLFLDLETGIIEDIQLANIEGMQQVAQTIQPLIADPSLTHELMERGALTRIQSEGNSGIVRQYQVAVNNELKERYPDDHLDHFMRFIMNESIREARLAYAFLMDEGAGKLGELREEIQSNNASKVVANATDAASLRKSLVRLSYEEHQEVLRAIIAMREDPTLPPVPFINFGEGKTTQKTGGVERRVRPDGGIEVKTGEVIRDEEDAKPNDG